MGGGGWGNILSCCTAHLHSGGHGEVETGGWKQVGMKAAGMAFGNFVLLPSLSPFLWIPPSSLPASLHTHTHMPSLFLSSTFFLCACFVALQFSLSNYIVPLFLSTYTTRRQWRQCGALPSLLTAHLLHSQALPACSSTVCCADTFRQFWTGWAWVKTGAVAGIFAAYMTFRFATPLLHTSSNTFSCDRQDRNSLSPLCLACMCCFLSLRQAPSFRQTRQTGRQVVETASGGIFPHLPFSLHS